MSQSIHHKSFMPKLSNFLVVLLIVLVAGGLYAVTLRGLPGNPQASDFKFNLDQNGKPFELSPERGRFVHLMALGENHTYALNQDLAEVAYPDVGYHGNKYFSFFQPGIAYMALPFYLLGRQYNLSQVFSFAFISLMAILDLLLLFAIARKILRLSLWTALAAVLIFGFGCTSWSYAITLYQHLVTVFFMLSGFFAVWKFRQQGRAGWLWAAYAGLVYALSVTIDSPNAILLLPVGLYLAISAFHVFKEQTGEVTISFRFGALTGLVTFLLGAALLMSFNQYYLGSWHTLNGSLPDYHSIYATPKTPAVVPALQDPVTVTAPPSSKDVVGFFKQEAVPQGFTVLLFSRDRGLFVFAPIFLLALLGIYYLVKRGMVLEITILFALVATNVLLYSSWGDPWGGWAYGPRYLIPSMSILSLFIGVALSHAKSWWLNILAFLLFAYSSAVALLGAVTTNANPAKNEALALHTGYNFIRNWEFLQKGISGGYVYNVFFAQNISLTDYFFAIYSFLIFLGIVIFLILPFYEPKA